MITVTIMKKRLKTRVGIFINMGGNFPGGSFPDTVFSITDYRKKKLSAQ